MSLAEIQAELPRLTPIEREQVEAQLRLLRWKETPGLAERLSAAHARMDAGHFMTQEQIMERLRLERPDVLGE